MIFRVLFALLVLAFPARAQQTLPSITADINSNLPSCGDMCISANALRFVLQQMAGATFQFTQFPNTFTAPQTFSAGYSVTGNQPAGASLTSAPIVELGTITGTGTITDTPFHYIGFTDKATNVAANTQITALDVYHFFGASGTGPGFRSAGNFALSDNQGAANYTGAAGFSALQMTAVAVNNEGGTAPAPVGDWFGASYLVLAAPGATFLNSIQSQENDISVLTGSTVKWKMGMTINNGGPGNNDAVQGTSVDAALILFTGPAASVKWLNGIQFGRENSTKWPIDGTNGTMIGTGATSDSKTAKNGIDFSAVTFSGYSLRFPNFNVNDATGVATFGTVSTDTGIVNSVGNVQVENNFAIVGASPDNWMKVTGAATDEKYWDHFGTCTGGCGAGTGKMTFRVLNDALNAANSWMSVTRNGTTVTGITFGGTVGIPQSTWADNQTCTAGQISVDASFVYVCTTTNTVKRAALSSF